MDLINFPTFVKEDIEEDVRAPGAVEDPREHDRLLAVLAGQLPVHVPLDVLHALDHELQANALYTE